MKKLSLIGFSVWTVLVIVILSFGTEPFKKIVNKITDSIYSEEIKLDDVIVERTVFYQGEEVYMGYSVTPDNYRDMGITFTSLDEEVFTVENNHKIISKRLDVDEAKAKVLITSILHPEFRKEVELTFKKVYATSVNFSTTNFSKDNVNVFIDIPFTLTYNLSADMTVTETSECELIYDTNFLELISQNRNTYRFKPKIEGYGIGDTFENKEITVTLRYYDKEFSQTLYINPTEAYTDFEEYVIYPGSTETNANIGTTIVLGRKSYFKFKIDDEIIPTTYELLSSNEEIVKISEDMYFTGMKTGTAIVTVKLPSGATKDIEIKVKNDINMPTFSKNYLDEDGTYHVMSDQPIFINVHLDNEVTFDATSISFTSEHSEITYERIENTYSYVINISFSSEGTDTITVKVDDPDTKYEKVINLKCIVAIKSYENINTKVRVFTGKVAGHMAFFLLEAILACLVLYFYSTKDKWLNLVIFIAIGTFLAAITEFIQFFIPGRYCSLKDVLTDSMGYVIGGLLMMIVFYIIAQIKKHKNSQNDNNEVAE